MKCAILAVGSEILLGDIYNSNAQTLSKELTAMGYRVSVHLAVADEGEDILDALNYSSPRADILFVTGGLGPTTDDFTRNLVSEWSERPLEFHEPSWEQIKLRFAEINQTVHEFQRQQCFFPKGADVLFNRRGTANGFHLKKGDKEVFVLPGPPAEIAAIWEDHVRESLAARIPKNQAFTTKSWFCLGPGESQVAVIVEPALSELGVDYGYRVHFPYVEVRLEAEREKLVAANTIWDRLGEDLKALGQVTAFGEPLKALSKALAADHRLLVFDQSTHQSLSRSLAASDFNIQGLSSLEFEDESNRTVFGFKQRGKWNYEAVLFYRKQWKKKALPCPKRYSGKKAENFALEHAFWFWLREIGQNS